MTKVIQTVMPRARIGRPKRSPDEYVIVNARMTVAEREALKAMASRAGVSLSSLLRTWPGHLVDVLDYLEEDRANEAVGFLAQVVRPEAEEQKEGPAEH